MYLKYVTCYAKKYKWFEKQAAFSIRKFDLLSKTCTYAWNKMLTHKDFISNTFLQIYTVSAITIVWKYASC